MESIDALNECGAGAPDMHLWIQVGSIYMQVLAYQHPEFQILERCIWMYCKSLMEHIFRQNLEYHVLGKLWKLET